MAKKKKQESESGETQPVSAAVDEGLADAARAVTAAGASDMTRGVDAQIAAERMADFGEVVGEAGAADVVQGAALLAASDDIRAIGAVVSMMSADDLERGMQLARIAGELWTASDVVDMMGMPVLAELLESRGEQLQQIAVDVLLRFGSTRALSELAAQTGAAVADLGENEVVEGVVRMAASAAMSARSEELSAAGEALMTAGAVEIAVADAAMEAAQESTAKPAKKPKAK